MNQLNQLNYLALVNKINSAKPKQLQVLAKDLHHDLRTYDANHRIYSILAFSLIVERIKTISKIKISYELINSIKQSLGISSNFLDANIDFKLADLFSLSITESWYVYSYKEIIKLHSLLNDKEYFPGLTVRLRLPAIDKFYSRKEAEVSKRLLVKMGLSDSVLMKYVSTNDEKPIAISTFESDKDLFKLTSLLNDVFKDIQHEVEQATD